tara:strand:+ start:660 stop:2261 length:1602 start_codon:yes stop_codon:yes gene_type:complete
MSSQSITNKLIANIKQTSSSNITTINSEKVICIDSSKNAIGINTLNPTKALTISGGDNSFNAVSAPYLYITICGDINELSTNFLFANDASINDLSLINADFSYINGLKADISNLDVSYINIQSNFLHVETISCDDLSVINLYVINTIDCSLGKFKEIQLSGNFNLGQEIEVNEIDVSYLYVSICGDISFIICKTISAENISCDFLDIEQTLDVSSINANSIDIANSLTIQQDLSVNGSSFFTTISANDIQIGLSGITEFVESKVNNVLDGGNQEPIFKNVTITENLNMFNSDTNINLNSQTNINNGVVRPNSIVIPGTESSNQEFENFIYFSNNKLHIGSQSIVFTSNIIYLTCDNNISGQRSSDFFTDYNGYDVSFYNNLKIEKPINLLNNDNKYNSYSFKFIPLKIENSSYPNIFEIDDSSKSYLKITTTDVSFELYANVSFKFYNRIANDVEVNNYIFGVCDISNGDKLYTSIQNSIMVFDNSFNYANSSINYCGSFYNTSNNPRLQFFVGSVKDNSFIYIDSFSATIKF